MNHVLAKTLIITKVVELIAHNYNVPLKEARNLLFQSPLINLIEDDETGLYGQSPIYCFSIFESQYNPDFVRTE